MDPLETLRAFLRARIQILNTCVQALLKYLVEKGSLHQSALKQGLEWLLNGLLDLVTDVPSAPELVRNSFQTEFVPDIRMPNLPNYIPEALKNVW